MKLKLNKTQLLLAVLILVIFFSLRLVKLDNLPIFVDEAIYVRWAQVMRNEPTLRFLPQSDGKQPLFMWSIIPVFKIIADPLIAGRLVSLAAGFGTLLGIGILAVLLSQSLTTGLFASLLYALTPFTVFFDRMALVDSLLTTFGLYSLIIGLLFVRFLRLDLAMILGFILGGGLLTKSPAIIFYLWQPILALFFFRPQTKNIKLSLAKLLGGWSVAFIISRAMFNILRLGPNFHLITSRNQDYVYSFKEILTHPHLPLIYNLQNSFSWLWLLLTPATIILLAISWLTKKKKTILLLFLLSLAPLFAQASIAKVYTSRYLLFTIPPLLISASLGLDLFFKKIKFLPLILIFFLIPLSLSIAYVLAPEKAPMSFDMRHGYLEEWTAGTGQKQVANYLINQANQGAKIVVGTEGSFGTLPDGLQIYTQATPNLTVIGVGLPILKIPDSLTNTSPENQVYFVLNKSRNLLGQSELVKLKLIKTYPKAIRADGSREELQFYQLINKP